MVDFDLAQRIKEISGLETENFLISLDNYAVLHILNKHSLENEKNHQQIGVEKDDFLKILEVIFSAEKIEYRSKSWRTGKDLLFFSKQISNLYEVVLEVRTVQKKGKKNRLAITTFYIKQKN